MRMNISWLRKRPYRWSAALLSVAVAVLYFQGSREPLAIRFCGYTNSASGTAVALFQVRNTKPYPLTYIRTGLQYKKDGKWHLTASTAGSLDTLGPSQEHQFEMPVSREIIDANW